MNKLVFDLGYHIGKDSEHYINKGYNVVAVEANPQLINSYRHDNLIILNAAIVSESYTSAITKFYVNSNKSDWSSCNQSIAEQDQSKSIELNVPTTTLKKLVDTYGLPHYLKVDVEGMDIEIADQLSKLYMKPQYVSFELNKRDYAEIFFYLKSAGYKSFQLINQLNNEPYSSGTFGEFLDKDRWLSFDEALSRYIKYRELKFIDNKHLAMGWIDVHARLQG